jgi:hypothetical protein
VFSMYYPLRDPGLAQQNTHRSDASHCDSIRVRPSLELASLCAVPFWEPSCLFIVSALCKSLCD